MVITLLCFILHFLATDSINTLESLNKAWLGNLGNAQIESSGPLNNTFQTGRAVSPFNELWCKQISLMQVGNANHACDCADKLSIQSSKFSQDRMQSVFQTGPGLSVKYLYQAGACGYGPIFPDESLGDPLSVLAIPNCAPIFPASIQ